MPRRSRLIPTRFIASSDNDSARDEEVYVYIFAPKRPLVMDPCKLGKPVNVRDETRNILVHPELLGHTIWQIWVDEALKPNKLAMSNKRSKLFCVSTITINTLLNFRVMQPRVPRLPCSNKVRVWAKCLELLPSPNLDQVHK